LIVLNAAAIKIGTRIETAKTKERTIPKLRKSRAPKKVLILPLGTKGVQEIENAEIIETATRIGTTKSNNQKMRKSFIALLALFIMTSCEQGLVKSEYKSTNNGVWEKDNPLAFSFSELDSITAYNMFINIRNDDEFAYNNLFLITELKAPDGSIEKDTLEYQMANPEGKWLGQGYGSLKENKLWYKTNIVFPDSGVYNLTIAHAMRKNGSVNGVSQLRGITDVGYEIVKSNTGK